MSDAQNIGSTSSPSGARPRRRWYQFGLRTLFLLTTVAIGLLVAWRICVEPYRRQREAMAVIERLGGTFESREAAAWQRRLFGADAQDITRVNLADCDQVEEYFSHIARLPCLETLAVGGPQFHDAHLRRLSLPTLKELILDSTAVTDEGLLAWTARCPAVETYRSQRRAIAAPRRLSFEVLSEGAAARNRFPLWLADNLFEEACLVRDPIPPKPVAEDLVLAPSATTAAELVGSPMANLVADVPLGPPMLGEELSPLQQLRTLRWLYLHSPRIGDEEMAYIRDLVHLESLDLASVRVTDRGIANLVGLRNLRWLYLNDTRIGNEGLTHVAQLSALAWLELDRTPISDDGLACLEASRVGYLSLCGTHVSDAGIAKLQSNRRLKDLRLVGTRVTDEGVDSFRSARPDCFVQGPVAR